MFDWDAVLAQLADDPEDIERHRGTVCFVRHGQDYLLTLVEAPGIGLAVTNDQNPDLKTPIAKYIQQNILGLPKLARQITRALERAAQNRPVPYVDGEARFVTGSSEGRVAAASEGLQQLIDEAEPGSTRLIQLMGGAGQGKTMLLERVALERARRYQPDPYPVPLLLPVDLLGRYVGNIDDAIAGSLNNTYLFPSLSQRDVALATKLRWLVLALDGFDELVARIGARDAFQRITELLDQLDGQGTIILSARESFFELYQISAAIRTYLQPRRGSYSTVSIELLPWTSKQGVEVFAVLDSPQPQDDFAGLASAFPGDEDLVLQPFFLTRLAERWRSGDRFADAGELVGRLDRISYMIERLLDRESGLKWTDHDATTPLLDTRGHARMLGAIAEEMWRAGAFRLDAEEIRLAAEIGLVPEQLSRDTLDAIRARVPTHAALVPKDRGYGFLHDHLFFYFLGHRIAELIARRDVAALRLIFEQRELSPELVDWIVWHWQRLQASVDDAIALLNDLATEAETVGSANLGRVSARLLHSSQVTNAHLRQQVFAGDALKDVRLTRVTFQACQFWRCDLSGANLIECEFRGCEIGDLLLDERTTLEGSKFENTSVFSVAVKERGTFFAPELVTKMLGQHGAIIAPPGEPQSASKGTMRASVEAAHVVEQLVRQSQITCDFAIEEMEERYGHVARDIIRIGLEAGVLRRVTKSVAGPRRTFVRFCVDRDSLVEGQIAEEVPDAAIERFWTTVGRRYPYTEDG